MIRKTAIIIIILLSASHVFCLSTETYTSDSDFLNFAIDGIKIAGTGAEAKLTLVHDWVNSIIIGVPSARHSTAVASDTNTHVSLLFGGRDNDGGALQDIWLFDCIGKDWVQKSSDPRPQARFGHGMVSLSSGVYMLFGGQDNSGKYFNDTWIYQSSSNIWYRKDTTVMPSSRTYFSIDYCRADNRVYIFGGVNGTVLSNDVWRYDVSAGSWSQVQVDVSSPSPRFGSGMAYEPAAGYFVVFGGARDFSNTYGDLWLFYPGTGIWQKKNPQDGNFPSGRSDFIFEYMKGPARFLLFGGWTGGVLSDETWVYDASGNKWSSTAYRVDQSRPSARDKIQTLSGIGNSISIFGGSAGTAKNDFWTYELRSSGTFIASSYSNDPSVWQKIITDSIVIPSSTTIKFQAASSLTGSDWTAFCGFDGSAGTFYTGTGPHNLWAGHSDKKFFKLKGYFDSAVAPVSPEIGELKIVRNLRPFAAVPALPANNSRTNSLTPVFTWNAAADTDNDPIYYRFQAADNSGFFNNRIDRNFLPETSSGVMQCQPGSGEELSPGAWYWRVLSADSSTGPWSQAWKVTIDTISPSSVASAVAVTGNTNGSIIISFYSTGDDGDFGDISGGACLVKYSTSGPVIGPPGWDIAPGGREIPFSSAQGGIVPVSVDSLINAATYYFALKLRDPAGNVSGISSVSPSAATNSPPSVVLSSPAAETILSREICINWIVNDYDTGDTNETALMLSFDGGLNYNIIIASSLANGATFFLWNTRSVNNGPNYRIKARVSDFKGLTGETETPGNFSINNVNEPPQLSIVKPEAGKNLFGFTTVAWILTDVNGPDTHTMYVYISSSEGAPWAPADNFTVSSTFYLLNTARFANGPAYRIKIKAAENNTAELYESNEAVSGSFIFCNDNRPPNAFSLTGPADNSIVQVIKVALTWQKNGDPNHEDSVAYTLFYSSGSNFFPVIEISSINAAEYTLSAPLIEENRKYYWRVRASDPMGASTPSSETFTFNTLERTKSISPDGVLSAEIISGMPDGCFLMIEKVVDPSALIAAAEINAAADRHIKAFADKIYLAQIVDITGKKTDASNVSAKVEMNYTDADNNKYFDGTFVPGENLRVARLNETALRWEIPSGRQSSDTARKKVTALVSGLSYFSLAGSNPTKGLLSGINIFPNPFSPGKEELRILYVLSADSEVEVRIYSLIGEPVKSWNFNAAGNPNGATSELKWDGRNGAGRIVANGMYLMTLRAKGGGAETMEKKYIGVIK